MSEICKCGHKKTDHIYEDGACRSGEKCDCQKYEEDICCKCKHQFMTKGPYVYCIYDHRLSNKFEAKRLIMKEELDKKPYAPTRLDYFIAHIVTGCLAKSCGSSNPKEIVDYAKELITEIDKQEGEK